jgi:hypothetical protein
MIVNFKAKFEAKFEVFFIELVIHILYWRQQRNSYVVSCYDKKVINKIIFRLLEIQNNIERNYSSIEESSGYISE